MHNFGTLFEISNQHYPVWTSIDVLKRRRVMNSHFEWFANSPEVKHKLPDVLW